MIQKGITLTQFIIEDQRNAKGATGDFSVLLSDVITACKTISHLVSRGGLGADADDPKDYLERAASDSMIKSAIWTGHLAGLSSKAVDGMTPIPAKYPRGKYLLVFDPLNGSGNLDINFMSGTIFSILRAPVGRRRRARRPGRPLTAGRADPARL